MNKEWSELNKHMQEQLRKEQTYKEGIETLIVLRGKMMAELFRMKRELSKEEFSRMPFPNANGYHNKTIAYSIWHIFRIEDIVAHSLIQGNEEIFSIAEYQMRIKSPIITTGNELQEKQIVDFSKKIDIDQLYQYIEQVQESTDSLLKSFTFSDMKRKYGEEDKNRLYGLQVVSSDEKTNWLIDYWCGKDIRGLIQMPFSRHWIMHVEASLRIESKLCK